VTGWLRGSWLPTSVTGELAREHRRTRVVRIALSLSAFGLLAVALLVSRELEALPTSYFATGSGGIVVLDLSTSVDQQKAERVQRVLQSFAETEGRVGLVVFSDSAYEMLPPDTRSEELRPLLRFFAPNPGAGFQRDGRRGERRSQTEQQRPEESPWSLSFRGGTKISTGLAEARRVIDREGNRSLSVLLLSDLDNSGFDNSALVDELTAYEQLGISLRVIPLSPAPEDRAFVAQTAGDHVFVERAELLGNTAVREELTLVGTFPWLLILVSGALLALLAANASWCAPLAFRLARGGNHDARRWLARGGNHDARLRLARGGNHVSPTGPLLFGSWRRTLMSPLGRVNRPSGATVRGTTEKGEAERGVGS